ncbi:hypothetical protein GT755_14370 [Herbidospora sp. NEAU-GS84]|uniref:Uncharacterized protein n=1 Tax=Herbidospora solisilvae TaxID=2696284 RepID=A0A7C9MX68_9ACTN|nr:hypothetical protein [Herbidospora solisilvae]NAS22871.1 hypothetical protein [Herbidospora solisilvae]
MRENWDQRVIKRDVKSWLGPRLILAALLINLIWEIIKNNLDPDIRKQWPWRLIILDLSATATLAGIIATLILARIQLSKSTHPYLTWTAHQEPSRFIQNSQRTLHLKNAGPGRAIVHDVKYRYSLSGESNNNADPLSTCEWQSRGDVVARIENAGLSHHADFAILALHKGAGIPPSGASDPGTEIVALNNKAMSVLARLDMRLQVVDTAGDRHERIIWCIKRSPYDHVRRVFAFHQDVETAEENTDAEKYLEQGP